MTVRAGTANPLPGAIALTRLGPIDGSAGGPASSVVLKTLSAASIGVSHPGGNETARLVFEVRDAQGKPVDLAHRATIQFAISQKAGGGAYLSPDTVSTDESGITAVALNSGTLAQAVQVRAQVMGTGICSDPVSVAIHGGLPNAQHFSFAVEKFNLPGLVAYGLLDPVTAFVGDRYGNPVPAGTVVYFATAGGLIQGSATTDDHGRATVDLETAEPLPNNLPAFSDSAGLARISVQTMDENRVPIVRSALAVMFSGHTDLLVSPSGAFNVPLSAAQDFSVSVWDREHHNPLTAGTKITVSATQGTLGGETSVTLPDTWDRAYTGFTFRLENYATGPAIVGPNHVMVRLSPLRASRADAGRVEATSAATGLPRTTAAQPVTVTVTVASVNGNAHTILAGTVERP
jgi:hypothetical protein